MNKAFEKILEILEEKKQYFQKFYETDGKTKEDENINKATQLAFDDAKNIVQEVAEEYKDDWIPCSERIPTEKERWLGKDITDAEPREFIIMVKGAYEPTTGYYHSGYGCWVKDLTSEYDDKNTGYGNEIVAWRFFPKPYKF